jgi:hypothetical protein
MKRSQCKTVSTLLGAASLVALAGPSRRYNLT